MPGALRKIQGSPKEAKRRHHVAGPLHPTPQEAEQPSSCVLHTGLPRKIELDKGSWSLHKPLKVNFIIQRIALQRLTDFTKKSPDPHTVLIPLT